MYLEYTCATISPQKAERLMKGARRTNYRDLVKKIREELPELYAELALNFYNPWSGECRETDKYYILVHSDIEYFINKGDLGG